MVVSPTAALAAGGPVVRPDGDIVRQWTGTPGSAAAAIADAVVQPTAVSGANFIYGSRPGNVTVGTRNLAGGIAASEAWVCANTGSTTTLLIEAVSQ